MRTFFHNGEILGERIRLFCEPRFYVSVGGTGGSSTSHTTTGTTSGASSPVAAEGSQAIGSGSIGLGNSAEYLESGATNNTGANQSTNISAGKGSSVVIGDPNADNVISQLAQQFASTVQNTAASAASGVQAAVAANQSTASTIPWKQLGIFVAIIAAIIGLFSLLDRKGK